MPAYPPESLVIVHPFTRQPDGDEIIIGRKETGVFFAVPPEAVELLDHLAQGKTVGETADFYRQRYGETPDLDDFLSLLEGKGIVKSQAGGWTAGTERPTSPLPAPLRYHFAGFPESVAQALFSPLALAIYFSIILAGLTLVFVDSWLRPGPRDWYFSDHRTLTWSLLILASYATIFVHEFAHLVAARSRGVQSRLGIGHRLWYLVAETDLTGLWAIPKWKRYLPLLAGVLIDAVSASILLLLLFVYHRGGLSLSWLALRLMRGMVFTYLMRIFWQCFFYIKTDFYYVIANLFNCRNLLKDTEVFLRNQLARIIRRIRIVDQSSIPTAERRVIRVYSLAWVGGRIFAVILLFTITIPLASRYIRNLAGAIHAGYSADSYNFFDAVLLAAYVLIPLIAGFTLWVKSLLRRGRT